MHHLVVSDSRAAAEALQAGAEVHQGKPSRGRPFRRRFTEFFETAVSGLVRPSLNVIIAS